MALKGNEGSGEELARLRAENDRLQQAAVMAQLDAQDRAQTINIKQVNQGCLGGCGGAIVTIFALVAVLGTCTG